MPKNTQDDSQNKLVGEVAINDYRKICVNINVYKGKEKIDIREMIDLNTNLQDPNWIYTKRGVGVPIEECDKFYKLIKKAVKPYLVA